MHERQRKRSDARPHLEHVLRAGKLHQLADTLDHMVVDEEILPEAMLGGKAKLIKQLARGSTIGKRRYGHGSSFHRGASRKCISLSRFWLKMSIYGAGNGSVAHTMQSDRPLNQQKAAKASIKLRRLAPSRGIHRYPRDTERHKSTFLAKIGFTNLKTPIPCKRPPATRRRRAQQTRTKKRNAADRSKAAGVPLRLVDQAREKGLALLDGLATHQAAPLAGIA